MVRAHIHGRTLARLAAVAAFAAGVILASSPAANADVAEEPEPDIVHEVILPSPIGKDLVTPDDWSWA